MNPNQPPHDIEAERSTLGGMMLEGTAVDEACRILDTGHFYSDANSKLFAVIRDMHNAGKPTDVVTVGYELEARKQFEEVGGAGYLIQILESVPHAAHTAHYAQIVRDLSDRRQVIEHATRLIRAAYDRGEDTGAVLASVEQSINRLSESRAAGSDTVSLMDVMVDAVQRIEAGTTQGLKTGFDDLDEKTTGIHPGQLIVLAARPSVGKSAFACCLAYQMSPAVPTMYFSLEMSKLELAERMLSLESGLSVTDMRGELDDSQRKSLQDGANMLYDKRLHIDDTADSTIGRIASVARLMQRRHKIGLVIVDYLQLVTPSDRKQPREQQVADMSRQLKHLAKSMGVPVIVLAQLNRQLESRSNKEPRMSDLRESGAIEQDADQVWLLHRPAMHMEDKTSVAYEETKALAKVIVDKNRSGPTGVVDMAFLEDLMRFRPAAFTPPSFSERF